MSEYKRVSSIVQGIFNDDDQANEYNLQQHRINNKQHHLTNFFASIVPEKYRNNSCQTYYATNNVSIQVNNQDLLPKQYVNNSIQVNMNSDPSITYSKDVSTQTTILDRIMIEKYVSTESKFINSLYKNREIRCVNKFINKLNINISEFNKKWNYKTKHCKLYNNNFVYIIDYNNLNKIKCNISYENTMQKNMCNKCKTLYNTDQHHMCIKKIKNYKNTYQCDKCNIFKCRYLSDLNNHICGKYYICEKCNKKYDKKSLLKMHLRRNTCK